jgi:serine protease AprX
VAAAAAMIAGMAGPAAAAQSPTTSVLSASSAESVSVIVRELPGAGDGPEAAVTAVGGTVAEPLGLIGGFTASVPADRVDVLRTVPGVFSVTENAPVTLNGEVEDQNGLPSSLHTITNTVINADDFWKGSYTGQGIDVAVIDSGVVPVNGLSSPGKVVHGPDLSFEAQVCDPTCRPSPLQHLDTYGHGTHMAGIIAGRDDAVTKVVAGDTANFLGVAPDARIVSVKVADAHGATDVSQVIAAIDWVVQNRKANGLNIRVLNLSFGTDGVQSYQLDPLTYAVEQAWHQGIVVVVAAGNADFGTEKLNNPAYDPFVVAVGAVDHQGTHGTYDDVVPEWSAIGDNGRNPDVVAPGRSVVGLRAPGSYLDNKYPGARTGERFFRGNGTSQAAAVTSGAAALLLSKFPSANPDQIKALLRDTTQKLPNAHPVAQGRGLVDLANAYTKTSPKPAFVAAQTWTRATGLGSLQAARGTGTLDFGGVRLEGEVDVLGRPWLPAVWAPASAAGATWTGGSLTSSGWQGGAWLGTDWYPKEVQGTPPDSLTGLTWSGLTWSGLTWSGLTWSGLTWSGLTWSGLTWSGLTWSGLTWSGLTWSGLTWSGLTWSGLTWSGLTWSGLTWSGLTWSGLTWSGLTWSGLTWG